MFTVELLPARHGDALWITYGDPADLHHVLIDGGPSSRETSTTITGLLASASKLDLVVVTHIDADHIAGVLSIFENRAVVLSPGDVWFNGQRHLPTELLGARQGERLTREIIRRRLPWNQAFKGQAVCVPDAGPLPEVILPGGLRLILVSPDRASLTALAPVWAKVVQDAETGPAAAGDGPSVPPDLLGGGAPPNVKRLAKEKFVPDDSEANGTSIAFVAEYGGKSVLLTGDAHAGVLASGLRRLANQRGTRKVQADAFKLPHHGSRFNLSAEVLDLVDCPRYLISTDGKSTSKHPDPVAIARIVSRPRHVSLEFNYHSATTEPWAEWQQNHNYTAVYPADGDRWLKVDL